VTTRLKAINACCECTYSRERSACYHPAVPDRHDDEGRPPFNDRSSHDVWCYKRLPPVPPGVGGFPEYQPPPDWCPLPSDQSDRVKQLEAQVAAMKLRALAAHEAVWNAQQGGASAALAAVQDDGTVHLAIEAIISVETESVTTPKEWVDHLARQDRRIDYLESRLRER